MATMEISWRWTCKKCGHNVIEDGCNFIYSWGQVQECGRCEQRDHLPEFKPVLNKAEEQLEFDFMKDLRNDNTQN